MDTNEKLAFISEALEVDDTEEITTTTKLEDIDEWDSIGV